MNLLGRGNFSVLLLIFTIFFSCEDASEIGLNINPEDDKVSLNFKSIDLPVSNILMDSVRTDNSGLFTVGILEDELYGKVTSVANTQFSLLPGASFISSREAMLDSMVLNLSLARVYGKDISQPQRFLVYQLADTLFNGVNYLSRMSTPREEELLGSASIVLQPGGDAQVLSVRLQGAFVDSLFERSKALISQNVFRNFFRGLAIVPAETNSVMVDFNPLNEASNITMFHNIPALDLDSVIYRVGFTEESVVKYNHYKIDREGSVLDNVPMNEQFSPSDGLIHLLPGIGIVPVIDFSPLKAFADSIGTIAINKVEIEFGPNILHNQYTYIPPPGEIRYVVLRNGRINGPGTISNPTEHMAMDDNSFIQGSLTAANHTYKSDIFRHYSGSLSIFSEFLISDRIDSDQIAVLPRFTSNFSQAAFDTGSVRIKVFYLQINNL